MGSALLFLGTGCAVSVTAKRTDNDPRNNLPKPSFGSRK
jgi:hypothetical protein